MGILLVILPLAGLVVFILLVADIPVKRRIALIVFMIFWAALMGGIGYAVGGISPTYRGNIAVEQILREGSKALDAGDCDNARVAFVKANQFLQKGGRTQDAVKLLLDRLHALPSGNTATSRPAPASP